MIEIKINDYKPVHRLKKINTLIDCNVWCSEGVAITKIWNYNSLFGFRRLRWGVSINHMVKIKMFYPSEYHFLPISTYVYTLTWGFSKGYGFLLIYSYIYSGLDFEFVRGWLVLSLGPMATDIRESKVPEFSSPWPWILWAGSYGLALHEHFYPRINGKNFFALAQSSKWARILWTLLERPVYFHFGGLYSPWPGYITSWLCITCPWISPIKPYVDNNQCIQKPCWRYF